MHCDDYRNQSLYSAMRCADTDRRSENLERERHGFACYADVIIFHVEKRDLGPKDGHCFWFVLRYQVLLVALGIMDMHEAADMNKQ